jgi:hypothetical protein
VTVELDTAAIGRDQPGNHVEHGRLAGTVRAEQANGFALVWLGYLEALCQWKLLDFYDYESLIELLPKLPEQPYLEINALPAFDQSLSFVYLYIGAPDRVLDYQERQARYPLLGASQVRYLWGPEFSSVRKTERFKTFVRKMGFVEYWRARGWPDLCRAVGADNFVCD